MADDELFTRDEVVGGLPARRAATLLFLIESRTAHLVARSQQDAELFLTEEVAKERELAFLEAFAMGQAPPLRPTIQDLEHHAPQWAPLVPANPSLRAAVAYLLGQKYTFTAQAVPGIRATLGLDSEAVQRAYLRLYRKPLETLFAPQVTLAERLRWVWASLARWPELLSPFWTTFTLTIALSLPQAFLGLPIALAHLGPLPGIALLAVFGLLNMLTMACMAEVCVRSGTMRYHKAFLGGLVSSYFGHRASVLLTVTTAVRTFAVLLAGFIGLGITLASFTAIHAAVWTVLFFLMLLYFLARGSFRIPVNALLLLLGINLGLFGAIVLLAIPHVQQAHLWYMRVPFLHGVPFDASLLQLLFGVLLMLYIGHVCVLQCANVVLPRDPSGRALIWGSVAGTAILTLLIAVWVVVISGVIAPEELANQAGTAITPLAHHVGPSIYVLGTLFVLLLLGNSNFKVSHILFNLVQERLPTQIRSTVLLPRRHGSLLLRRRGAFSDNLGLRLTYVGLTSGLPQLRLDVHVNDGTQHLDLTVREPWDIAAILDRVPALQPYRPALTLDVLEARPEQVRLRIGSSLSLTYEGGWDTVGLHLAETLVLPDQHRHLVNWMRRQTNVTLASVMAHTGQDEKGARTLLGALVDQGLLQVIHNDGTLYYRIRMAPRRGRHLSPSIWQSLDDATQGPTQKGYRPQRMGTDAAAQRLKALLLGARSRFWIAISPVVFTFLLAEWLLLSGTASFARVLSFAGVIANSLTAGIFPILLLLASRRKGDFVPGVVYGFLDRPVVAGTIYLLFVANLFLHGLIIWQNPLPRVCAVLFGLASIGLTVVMLRRGAFSRRLVVELREEQGQDGQAIFNVLAGGQPLAANVQLRYPDREEHVQSASGHISSFTDLCHLTVCLPPTAARDLKVWAHTITPEGTSESLPMWVEIHDDATDQQIEMQLSGGQVVLPITGAACWVRIRRPDLAST